MCICRTNQEDFVLARGLRSRGIPVDDYELERMEALCQGLEIAEDRSLPSTVFNLSSGGSGWLLNVVISNESDRPLAPLHIAFECADFEVSMSLLPDPHKQYPARRCHMRGLVRDNGGHFVAYSVARENYFYPTHPPIGFGRDEVLNHRIARSCILYPGDLWDGWLLAVGEKPIPLDYRDRDRLKLRLTVFDHRGRSHRALFHPLVQRSRQEQRRLAETAPRDEAYVREKRARAAARLGLDRHRSLGQDGSDDSRSSAAALVGE